MKIARTFTIDYSLAVKLQKKPNQSETVSRALRKYLSEDGVYDLTDVTTFSLIGVLQARFDHDSPEAKLLVALIAMCKQS